MQLDNLSIACLVKELSPLLEGAYVNKVSETADRKLKLKLHTKQGSKDLVIAGTAFFVSKYSIQAKHGKSTFATALNKVLYNKRITSMEQNDLDRVVSIKFLEHTLVLELLGEGNQILLDNEGRILACAKNEEWAGRKTKKGEQYIFPKHPQNPSALKAEQLSATFSGSGKDAIRALISGVNMPPFLAEEVFFRLGTPKEKNAAAITVAESGKIVSELHRIYTLPDDCKPVAYKGFVSPFRLSHLGEEPRPLKSVNDWLDETLAASSPRPEEAEKMAVSKSRSTGLEHMRRQQEEARRKFESQISENSRKAGLIYSHYAEIEELQKAVLAGIDKGLPEKKIIEAFRGAAAKGNAAAGLLKGLDIKRKKMEIELE